jgi:polar amino acid transport system substrate-binding protein
MFTKILSAILTTTLLALTLGGSPASAQTTLQKARQAGLIKIANTAAFPPMGFMENGNFVGFDRDFGEELAKRLGVKADWVIVDFKGMLASVKSGRADLLVSAATITPERLEQLSFSDGYIDFGIGAAYRNATPVKVPADGKGLVLGLQTGSPGAFWARDNLKDVKEVKSYDQLELALRDLELGRVDFVVNSLPGIRYSLKDKPGFGITDVWDSRVAGVGVRFEDKDLLEAVNAIIKQMNTEGYLLTLRRKWFGS